MSFEMTALLLSWVAILLLSLVVAGLVRQVHAIGQGPRPTALGLDTGSQAPGFERFGPGLLLFLSADCAACPDVLAAAESLTGPADPPVHALFAGAALPAERVTVHADEPALFEAYKIPATPFAVVVGESGRVTVSEPVGSPGALRELLNLEVSP
ncbi:hypothetical protein ACRYCC_24595 [Actinomadura scrupuli]|uniref:hypothetical protein n=1 Tax=Actinomadura scrupuli TaxID=559629 RepID=UPI003D999A3B